MPLFHNYCIFAVQKTLFRDDYGTTKKEGEHL